MISTFFSPLGPKTSLWIDAAFLLSVDFLNYLSIVSAFIQGKSDLPAAFESLECVLSSSYLSGSAGCWYEACGKVLPSNGRLKKSSG